MHLQDSGAYNASKDLAQGVGRFEVSVSMEYGGTAEAECAGIRPNPLVDRVQRSHVVYLVAHGLLSILLTLVPTVCEARRGGPPSFVEQLADNPSAAVTQADVAMQRAKKDGDKQAQLERLHELTVGYITVRDFDRSARYVDEGLRLSRELRDLAMECHFLSFRAIVVEAQGHPVEALAWMEEAIALSHKHGLDVIEAQMHYRKGGMYDTLGRKADALTSFQRMFAMAEQRKSVQLRVFALTAMGNVYVNHRESDADLVQATDYFERALQLNEQMPNPGSRLAALIGLGKAYHHRKDHVRARMYYQNAQSSRDVLLAELASDEGNYLEALSLFDRALADSVTKKDRQSIFEQELGRAVVLAKLKRRDKALEALAHARAELPATNSRRLDREFYMRAATVHSELGDYGESYRAMVALRESEQKLATAAKAHVSEELRVRFDVRLKEVENALLRSQRETAETQNVVLLLIFVLSVVVLAVATLYLRKRAAIARAEALRNKELAAAGEAKSQFLTNMSHELRSPLNAMLGFARLLYRETSLSDRARRDLDIVLRSGEHLYSLINDVLELSKAGAGRLNVQTRSFDLCALLDELQTLFSLSARQKQITLEATVDQAIPQYVQADALKLRQVLINLMSNAIKFTDRGGVRLQVELEAQRLKFSIVDTGVGIEPEELPSLGKAFAQAGAGRRAAGGTGLGLALSRSYVEVMGGQLELKSLPGKGTTATFSLPLQHAAALTDDVATEALAIPRITRLLKDTPKLRVLAVDDAPESRLLLVGLLEPMGFEVREAENGLDAIRICEEWAPHLVWMDIRMPVLGGLEATRRIKAGGSTASVVVIALTASSFEEDRERMRAAGCDDFLRKPFSEASLLGMMHKHLGVEFMDEPVANEPGQACDLSELSSSDRAELKAALQQLDLDLIERSVDAIRSRDPVTAKRLSALIEQFRYREVLELLEREPETQEFAP